VNGLDRLLRAAIAIAFVAASAAVWWPRPVAAAPAPAAAAAAPAAPAAAFPVAAPAGAVRIKEVAAVQGVRSNPLVGYGLVVGLDGTGDQTTQTPFTTQSLNAMLQQLGVTVPPGTSMQLRNVAAVLVTAQLPPFAQPGQVIDINVSSLGNAKSLRGGTLVATPLRGADGQVYALAQGNLIVGGAGAAANGSKVQINHLSAGRVPEGATVERAVPNSLQLGDSLVLGLAANDYNTARAVAEAINRAKGPGTADAQDGRSVRVRVPPAGGDRVGFLADIENLPLTLAKPAARIVLNARTGSVVMNDAVTLGPCAVAHGSLTVTISTTPQVSQPNPLAGGNTVQADKSDIAINQQGGALIQMPAGAKLADVVKALNVMGATPMDLLAILQAMKSAGALNAEIEVI
jgi:flagellar P-ring protein precursor FlgI